MSEIDRNPSEHEDDDEEEDDGDYCPTANNAEKSSGSSSSEEDEGEEEVKEEEEKPKLYDPSKADELWKSFTSKPKEEVVAKPLPAPVQKTSSVVPAAAPAATNLKRPAPATSVLDRLGIGKKNENFDIRKISSRLANAQRK